MQDIPLEVEFYKKAFGFTTKFVHDSGQYVELDTGATSIAFASEQLGDVNLPNGYIQHRKVEKPCGNELVFTVEDLVQVYKDAIASGATALVEPQQKPWGQTVAYVRDPNGVLIELASKMQ